MTKLSIEVIANYCNFACTAKLLSWQFLILNNILFYILLLLVVTVMIPSANFYHVRYLKLKMLSCSSYLLAADNDSTDYFMSSKDNCWFYWVVHSFFQTHIISQFHLSYHSWGSLVIRERIGCHYISIMSLLRWILEISMNRLIL